MKILDYVELVEGMDINMKTKYYKIIITPLLWHLKPYKIKRNLCDNDITEYCFLCFKYVISYVN